MPTPDPFISGYRLTDGDQLNDVIGNPEWSYSREITATTGGTMQTSVKLTETINYVTVATPNAGITLPQALPGKVFIVQNSSANTIIIYADGDSSINGIPGTVGAALTYDSAIMLFSPKAYEWIVVQWSVSFVAPPTFHGLKGFLYSDGVNPVTTVLTSDQSRNALKQFTGTSGSGVGDNWLTIVNNNFAITHNDAEDDIAIRFNAGFWPVGQTAWIYVRSVLKAYYGWSDAVADARILTVQTYAYVNG